MAILHIPIALNIDRITKEQIYLTTLWDQLLVLSDSMQTPCETISL